MYIKRDTIQRRLIYDTVKELNCHATAEQTYDCVVNKCPTISKATVYRNLSQMAKSGKLLKIGDAVEACRYDHNCDNHYHFVCEQCKQVFDIEDYFYDISDKIKSPEGFEITGHSVTFNGLCPQCKCK